MKKIFYLNNKSLTLFLYFQPRNILDHATRSEKLSQSELAEGKHALESNQVVRKIHRSVKTMKNHKEIIFFVKKKISCQTVSFLFSVY